MTQKIYTGIDPKQLLIHVIQPALNAMGERFTRPGADILLLATAAQESLCGQFLRQLNGPALGIMQVEPRTHRSVAAWADAHGFGGALPGSRNDERLIYDLRYAVSVARLLYYSWPDPLPAPNMESMWATYKLQYNSAAGKATPEQFRANWTRFVAPVLGGAT